MKTDNIATISSLKAFFVSFTNLKAKQSYFDISFQISLLV